MNQADEITAVWASVREALPEGWALDSLRCASTGLTLPNRSAEWVAIATGPDGETREARAGDPVRALKRVAGELRREQ